jgi:hypothetical protein
MTRRRLVPAVFVALVLAAFPAAAGAVAVPITSDAALGAIAAVDDVVVWNGYDAGTGTYHLVAAGGSWGAARDVPVPAAPQAFDVSAGRGPDGLPWLVYTRCASYTPRAHGCDVASYRLGDAGEQAVAAAALAAWEERSPSIDGNRIVFARSHRGGAEQVIMVDRDAAGHLLRRSVPGAVPAGICGGNPRPGVSPCTPPRSLAVDATAIQGTWVAVALRGDSPSSSSGLCGQVSLRLVDRRTGTVRRLGSTTCGLSGQHYGPFGFDGAGRLWFALQCTGDPSACSGPTGVIRRYDPRTGQTATLPRPARTLLGPVASSTEPIVGTRLGVPAGTCETAYSDPLCFTLTALTGSPATTPWVAPKTPDVSLRIRSGGTGARVLEPLARVPCFVDGPHPGPGLVIWAGAFTTGGTTITARATGRPVQVARHVGRHGWGFARFATTGRASCGRTWTVTYTSPHRTRSFRVVVSRAG